jgi:hypothetical protein
MYAPHGTESGLGDGSRGENRFGDQCRGQVATLDLKSFVNGM